MDVLVPRFHARSLIVILGDHNKRTRLDSDEKTYHVASLVTHPAYDKVSMQGIPKG
jgi:hypothetical protein